MSLSVRIEKKLNGFQLRVDFETAGDLLALLGASGSGKSLTLRCIAGLLTPDRGKIVLNGRVLYDSAAGINLPPQQRRVGYLFQRGALIPHMSVLENVTLGYDGQPKARRKALALEQLRRFRLEDLAQARPA
ncbi:MAG: ATP-binding cassette domain-containing protein, partial [Oscillospiraceae bacterium]|nr:ATP-binding cassette domain-containing protein [Oscillospiraceae bacterium]